MNIETELKLSLPAGAVGTLRRHPLLAGTRPETERLTNVYYDTPDLDLWAAGMAVRHRRTRGGWLLTVKSGEPSVGGVARRREWEAPSLPATFSFAHVEDRRLRRRLAALAPRLQPVFSTNFLRTRWLLAPAPGVSIELALDRGEVRHGARSEPIREVELELLEGPPLALFQLAAALAADLPLTPAGDSKAERGFRLFAGTRPQPVRARKSPLLPSMSCRAAFQSVVLDCLDQLQRNMTGIAPGGEAEFVHQARVATRRLRSALRLWAPALPTPFVADCRPAWREAAQVLGELRNLDVFVEQTLPAMAADLPGNAALALCAAKAAKQRQAAGRRVRCLLRRREFLAFLLRFAADVHALDGAGDEPVLGDFARRRLKRFARTARALARGAADSPAARHRLRIACKRLRYAVEFMSPALPEKLPRGYLAALVDLQELLGQLNDLATAELLLARSGRGGRSVDAGAQAWLRARQAALLTSMPQRIAQFLAAPAPWGR